MGDRTEKDALFAEFAAVGEVLGTHRARMARLGSSSGASRAYPWSPVRPDRRPEDV